VNREAADSLAVVIGRYPHTEELLAHPQRLKDGTRLRLLTFEDAGGGMAAAVRMLRSIRGFDFDVCEVPIVNYLSAREHGAELTAIPVFPTRRFMSDTIVCNRAANIGHPKDLEGKYVGIHYFGHTDAAWGRAILTEMYQVDLDAITWVTSAEEQIEGARLPGNVVRIPRAPLGEMLRAGEISAQMFSHTQFAQAPELQPLFPEVEAHDERWFVKTGLFPILHTVVIKDSVLRERPQLAQELVDLFSRAKDEELDRLEAGRTRSIGEWERYEESGFPRRPFARSDRRYLGADPLPFGLKANRACLEALIGYSLQQRILGERLDLDDLFWSPDH
jgi:4,5-dihydroxyphthalate decarboxylase